MINNFKFLLAIASVILIVLGYIPYFRDIFKRTTTPHMYTWLIWAITQGTAAAALWYGGGNFSTISLVVGTVTVLAIFFLTFKYGTRNITKSDTAFLLLALLAIVIWWQLHDAMLAVILITFIDAIGYIPTFRKSFKEPWSETLSFWMTMAVADILIIASNAQYNFLTVTYVAMLTVANLIVWAICFFRRQSVPKSASL